jgi:hypothetical protein
VDLARVPDHSAVDVVSDVVVLAGAADDARDVVVSVRPADDARNAAVSVVAADDEGPKIRALKISRFV